MARKRRRRRSKALGARRGRTPQQRKFAKAARGAMSTCIRESSSMAAYKRCMSTEMKARL